MKQRVIDIGLAPEMESMKKGVNDLEVGFQQSSIETTLAGAICVAKQMGRFKTRMTSTVAEHSDASKMQHNGVTVGIQIALTSKAGALLNLQVSAYWTLKEPNSFLGSSLNGAAASEKRQSIITHLLKSKQYEIAVMPPEQLVLEVLMEKSAFVARQKSTQELERPSDCQHDAVEALKFEDPSKRHPEQACRLSLGIVEC